MSFKSLFSLPNLVGYLYLYLGIKSILFFENSLFSRYTHHLNKDNLLSTPLFSVVIFLLLAFFSFKKKMFPLHLLAAYLWVFYVAVVYFVVLGQLFGSPSMTLLENVKIIAVSIVVCSPVFIYSFCLYRYGKRRSTSLKSVNRRSHTDIA